MTGLPRSGMSLVAGSLNLCGAWVGPGTDENQTSPERTFENRQIRDQLIAPILAAMKCDPTGIRHLPPSVMDPSSPGRARGFHQVRGIGDALRAILSGQHYDSSRPWLYKDARLALLWPNFMAAFPQARWIIVRRDLDSFVNSCIRTMGGQSTEEAFWIALAAQYLQRLEALRDVSHQVREIWTDELFSSGPTVLLDALEHVGLPYKDKAIQHLVDPANWHGQSPRYDERSSLSRVRHFRTGAPLKIARSVALVGNSDLILGQSLGPRINQFDQVIRFNLAPAGGKYSDDVGSKSTYYYLSKNVTTWDIPGRPDTRQKLADICRAATVICHPGHYLNLPEGAETYHFEMGIHDINDVFFRTLAGTYRPFPHANHPRNGIKLLAALIGAGIRPTLFGFDLGARSQNAHYFDSEAQIENPTGGHQPSREYRLLNQLRHRGLINVVNHA